MRRCQRSSTDEFAGGQRLGAWLPRCRSSELRRTQGGTAKRIFSGSFVDQPAALKQPHFELCELFDERRDHLRLNGSLLPNNERRVQAEGRSKIDRLKFP